jgi:hypothetical protein
MRKFIAVLSIFLFLLFSMNTTTAIAQPKTFSQGFYTLKDLNLMANTPYSIQNISPIYKSFIIIFDSNQIIQQAVRLGPSSPKVPLIPFEYDYIIVVLGSGQLVMS